MKVKIKEWMKKRKHIMGVARWEENEVTSNEGRGEAGGGESQGRGYAAGAVPKEVKGGIRASVAGWLAGRRERMATG